MELKCSKCGKYFETEDTDEILYENCPYCGESVIFYPDDDEEDDCQEYDVEEIRYIFYEGITK